MLPQAILKDILFMIESNYRAKNPKNSSFHNFMKENILEILKMKIIYFDKFCS